MSFFAFLLLCIQACLIQDVFSQCIGSHAAVPAPAAALATPLPTPCNAALALIAAPFAASVTAPFTDHFLGQTAAVPSGAYGGAGTGEVSAVGELPVAGTTLVAGQVPILGAVEFGGPVCAGGAVTIAGNCACGCGPAGSFLY